MTFRHGYSSVYGAFVQAVADHSDRPFLHAPAAATADYTDAAISYTYSSASVAVRNLSSAYLGETVFDHMESLGIMLHIVTQETENELLLDGGDTGLQRKLYYRELNARFGHHLAITWNMGEENGPAHFTPEAQTIPQQKAMVKYLKESDPYDSYVVIHTHAAHKPRYEIFDQLLGDKNIEGPSIQILDMRDAHKETVHWTKASASAGQPWVVCIDEIGPAGRGVDPDDREDNNQNSVLAEVLWGNLTAGGGGAEWYFGYNNHNNDLNCEDWRSRDRMWEYTRIAIDFFQMYVPFWEMDSNDDLVSEGNYCLAKEGVAYLIYLPHGGSSTLNLESIEGEFSVDWFNTRTGGDFIKTETNMIKGEAIIDLATPPMDADKDWVVLVKKQ